MHINKNSKLVSILTIMSLLIWFSSCIRSQHVPEPGIAQANPGTPQEERDHVWVVDQDGVEVPVSGTWVLVAQTNQNSVSTLGERFTLPPDPPHSVLISDGAYMDDEDLLWTKVKITTHDGLELQFLERVDTRLSPHRLHVVFKTGADGLPVLEYAESPFNLPGHNVQIWEKR